jgi:hypothetical protein
MNVKAMVVTGQSETSRALSTDVKNLLLFAYTEHYFVTLLCYHSYFILHSKCRRSLPQVRQVHRQVTKSHF